MSDYGHVPRPLFTSCWLGVRWRGSVHGWRVSDGTPPSARLGAARTSVSLGLAGAGAALGVPRRQFPMVQLWPGHAPSAPGLGRACFLWPCFGQGVRPPPRLWDRHVPSAPGLAKGRLPCRGPGRGMPPLAPVWAGHGSHGPDLTGACGYCSFSYGDESKSLKMIVEVLWGTSSQGSNFRLQNIC